MSRSPISANERALLDTIRMAEGTWHGGGQKGYGTQFGGGQFDWSKGHPDRVVRSGGYASAAAGAYQFMPDTWRGVAKQIGIDPKDFSPEAQDRAALQLVRNRGVDPTKPLDAAALNKLAPEWASLPTSSGKSYYGQPVKNRDALLKFYGGRLGAAPNPGNSAPAAAAAAGGGAPVGGGGAGLPMGFDLAGAGMDLSAFQLGDTGLGAGSSIATPGLGSTAAALVLRQQADALNAPERQPLLASRRAQLAGPQRMAGSPGRNFFQQLLAFSQPLAPPF